MLLLFVRRYLHVSKALFCVCLSVRSVRLMFTKHTNYTKGIYAFMSIDHLILQKSHKTTRKLFVLSDSILGHTQIIYAIHCSFVFFGGVLLHFFFFLSPFEHIRAIAVANSKSNSNSSQRQASSTSTSI